MGMMTHVWMCILYPLFSNSMKREMNAVGKLETFNDIKINK